MTDLDLSKCFVKKEKKEEYALAKAIAKCIDKKTPDAHKEHQQRMLKVLEHSRVDKQKAVKEAAERICRALRGEQ